MSRRRHGDLRGAVPLHRTHPGRHLPGRHPGAHRHPGDPPGARRRRGEVDQVVVDDDRGDRAVREREGREQPIVDDHVTRHGADAGPAHLLRELVDAGERVLWRQRRARQGVRVVVVQVGERHISVGLGAPVHRHVALGDEHQVAPQRSPHHRASALDRGGDAVLGPEVLPAGPDAVGLGHRPGLHEAIGVVGHELLAGIQVAHRDVPLAPCVRRLVHHLQRRRIEARHRAGRGGRRGGPRTAGDRTGQGGDAAELRGSSHGRHPHRAE